MDRFIVISLSVCSASIITFKIQYGQIYRPQNYIPYIPKYILKSNMDRFIEKGVVNTANGVYF